MFVLIVLDKIKETRLKFSQGSVTVLQKMPNYEEVSVNYTNSELKTLESLACWNNIENNKEKRSI